MNELEIVTLIGSSLVGFIAPAFIEGSILQKTVTASYMQ